MVYLIDSNVLIQANQDYYPLDRLPQYWDWLIKNGIDGKIKMPEEIWEEIADSNKGTPLRDWVNQPEVKESLLLKQKVDKLILNRVIDKAYAPDPGRS